MVRLVGDVAPVRETLHRWAGGRAELSFGSHIPPQRFRVLDGFETAPMAYTSDIPILSPRWGTPLLFGPGSIHVAHTAHEHVELRALHDSVDAYERIVRSLLDA
jgi:acetylornithine deacetylase